MSQAAERWDLSYTQNRELSWLAFDQRVLEEAADPSVPLMERLRFLSIFTSNLDEFFMVRVGSLTDLALVAPNARENKGGFSRRNSCGGSMPPWCRWSGGRTRYTRELMEALAEHGVADIPYKELKNGEREYVRAWYREAMRPLLMPQIIDPSHPFPHLKNKTLYAAALLAGGRQAAAGHRGCRMWCRPSCLCRPGPAPSCGRRTFWPTTCGRSSRFIRSRSRRWCPSPGTQTSAMMRLWTRRTWTCAPR